MSEKQQVARPERKRRKRSTGKQRSFSVVWTLITIFTIILAFLLIRNFYNMAMQYQEIHKLEKQVDELKTRNKQLEDQVKKLQDMKTVEQVARDELGLVKPGEVPYVK